MSRISEISHRPERLFLILGLLGGLLFAFLTPPFQVPDEQTHLFRAYQIAEGGLIAQRVNGKSGGMLPRSLGRADSAFWQVRLRPDRKLDPTSIFDALGHPLDPQRRQFIDFNNTAVFSPIPYLPQALAIALVIPFELSPIIMMYLGRVASVVAIVVLIFLAIRLIPTFKYVTLSVALMPMFIFQMASLSADGITNALSLLFVALVLRSTIDFNTIYKWILVCAATIGLCKPAYTVLTLLVFVVPLVQTERSALRWLQAALVPAISFIASGAWAFLMRDVYAPIQWVDGIDPAAQMAFILGKPLSYLGEVFSHYSDSWYGNLELMIGRFGWLDTYLPWWFWNTYAALLVLLALTDGSPHFSISLSQKFICLSTVVIGIVSVTTALYICCNPLRGEVVQGAQGRYFIPFLLPALLGLYNQKLPQMLKSDSEKYGTIRGRGEVVLTVWLISSIAISLNIMLQRYYG